MKTNRITNPLGFDLGKPRLSFVTYDTKALKQTDAQIQVALDEEFTNIIFDSDRSEAIDSLAFELPINLQPCTRYYWRVTVWADNGDEATSETAFAGEQMIGCGPTVTGKFAMLTLNSGDSTEHSDDTTALYSPGLVTDSFSVPDVSNTNVVAPSGL